MINIEKELREIFAKDVITDKDMHRASELLRVWKHFTNWQEDTSNPIR